MDNRFFEQPVLNSRYEYPQQHWELDEQGQPTQRIIDSRRRVAFITPIPKPRKHRQQLELALGEGRGLSTTQQRYDPTSTINALRRQVDQWRSLPNPAANLLGTPSGTLEPRTLCAGESASALFGAQREPQAAPG